MKNLGLVLEYLKRDKIEYSEEVQDFMEHMKASRRDAYVINPLNGPVADGQLISLNLRTEEEERLPVESFDRLYFGNMGQKFHKQQFSNALAENLEAVCALIESLGTYNGSLKYMNPVDAMMWNTSKDYLIEMSGNSLPVVPTVSVDSLDQMVALNDDSRVYLVKPKIAERGNGSMILDGTKKYEEMAALFSNYVDFQKRPDDSLYARVMNKQGLIAQEYNKNFMDLGERKIFLLDGDITVSRKVLPRDPEDRRLKIVAAGRDGKSQFYEPNEAERHVATHAYDLLAQRFPGLRYLRVDLVPLGDNPSPEDIFISELEIINPCQSTGGTNKYQRADRIAYHNNILDSVLDG